MNIELLAKEIQKLGTDIEIITPKEDDEFVVKLLAELSPHTNTVAHDGAGMIDKYCKHDVQVLYNLDGQYFPCEHNKTMVILDTESEIQSNHLTSSDKWFWNEGKQQLLNRKNSDHYIDDMENKEGNSRGSWANILRTSFSALAPYEQTGQLVPVYAGPITEHAIDQITILDSVENVKQKIYNGATHIAFDDKDEALYWTRVYSCHSVIKRLKDIMPPGRFLFLTGALNGKEIYSQWCKDHGLEEELIMIPCARFEAVSKDMMWDGGLMHHHAEMDLPVYTGIRPKKYLCYNRMPRLHRLKIVTELHKAGIINQGLVSFYNEDNHLENPGWQEGHIEDQAWKETFEYFYENIFPELDYVLNKTEERWNPADLQRDDIDHFNQTYFSLVNETLFYKTSYPHKGLCDIQPTESVFLSEKIYKPLACKHPFVVVGVDKTLEYLKQFGYKTFDKWIDESYDNEPDEDKRMAMIVEEVKRLTAISHEEWQAMIIEMIPTLQHNFDTLCRNKNLITANINLSQVFRNDGPY